MVQPAKFSVRHNQEKYSPEFENLKLSIREHGLLQPILIRPVNHGFEIIAGHRRFNACKSLRWRFIPCKIKESSDKEAYEIQLTENVQRKSMDALEEAEAFRKYVIEFGWGGVSDLARKIGKSEEYISHRMQILKLPQNIRDQIAESKLSISKALELTTLEVDETNVVVDSTIKNHLTVRQIRQLKKELRENTMSFRGNPPPPKELNMKKAFGIVNKSSLALRVLLSRIDESVNEAHELSYNQKVELVRFLMDVRIRIHSMIDEMIQYKKKIE